MTVPSTRTRSAPKFSQSGRRPQLRRYAVTSGLIAALVLIGGPIARFANAASVGPNVNLSAALGNQVEPAIAVNPANPNQIFAVAMDETLAGGFVTARSSDGGATWTRGRVGTSVPIAAADPSVSFDSFGNLFLSYIDKGTRNAQILDLSTNGGATFSYLTALAAQPDQPTVTTGPGSSPGTGSVWVSWSGNLGYMWVDGAPVTGLGAVGAFGAAQAIIGSQGFSYGDIAVGPSGQVMMSFGPASAVLGGSIYTATSNGLGQPFGEAQPATTTVVGGFEAIPAQPTRGIDSESGLAYDRSSGPHKGRVYLMYTDATLAGSTNTDIYVRYSDNSGASWSGAVRVNDDAGSASQFLPRLAVDQTTGELGVSWYDTRNDPLNVQAELFGAFSTDGGATFTPNVKISARASSEAGADPPPAGYPDLDYGDYTGSSFAAGKLFPAWADNSNSTGENPDGTLKGFDIYTAAVQAPPLVSPPTLATEPASALTPISATLSASVNPNGAAVTDCHFDYGVTELYGSSAPCTPSPGSGNGPETVSASLTGLGVHTTYHFRIVATNLGGTSYGSDRTFTTLPITPIVGGAFVIGDPHTQPGETVTFWSGYWVLWNGLSGGGWPIGFSGFATSIPNNPPQCGDSWTSGLPGLFSKAPATVPELMYVIVSNSIASNWNWTSPSMYQGNTKKVLLVRTNPGYGPDWSHTGTATIVAQICP